MKAEYEQIIQDQIETLKKALMKLENEVRDGGDFHIISRYISIRNGICNLAKFLPQDMDADEIIKEQLSRLVELSKGIMERGTLTSVEAGRLLLDITDVIQHAIYWLEDA